jgi:hypothetical protein
MKNNIKTSLVLGIIILGISVMGCKEDDKVEATQPPNSYYDLQSVLSNSWSSVSDASVFVQHLGGISKDEYKINGYFYSSQQNKVCSNRVDVGTVIVGGFQLLKENASTNCLNYELDNANAFDDLSTLFGSSIQASLSGSSGYSNAAYNFNSIQKLNISSLLLTQSIAGFTEMGVISKNDGYTVTWNADPNNQSGNVVVLLSYSDFLSKQIDPSLTASKFSHHIITADDGSYTISQQDLATFPINGYVELIVGRGNITQWNNYGKVIDLISISRDNQDFVLIP